MNNFLDILLLTLSYHRLSPQFVVSGSQDLTIKLWTLPSEWSAGESDQHPVSLTAKLTEKAHDKDINSVTVSPNDKLIASGSQDKTAKVGDGPPSEPWLCLLLPCSVCYSN